MCLSASSHYAIVVYVANPSASSRGRIEAKRMHVGKFNKARMVGAIPNRKMMVEPHYVRSVLMILRRHFFTMDESIVDSAD